MLMLWQRQLASLCSGRCSTCQFGVNLQTATKRPVCTEDRAGVHPPSTRLQHVKSPAHTHRDPTNQQDSPNTSLHPQTTCGPEGRGGGCVLLLFCVPGGLGGVGVLGGGVQEQMEVRSADHGVVGLRHHNISRSTAPVWENVRTKAPLDVSTVFMFISCREERVQDCSACYTVKCVGRMRQIVMCVGEVCDVVKCVTRYHTLLFLCM